VERCSITCPLLYDLGFLILAGTGQLIGYG
jgi:hypothetical protein